MSCVSGIALACVLVVACGSNKDQEAGTSQEPGTSAPAPKSPAPPPSAPLDLLAESDVRGLVDEWLAAQNEGDFARYEPLYAERFTGIKRVGSRTHSYDRAGWVKDRERMFQKKMTVAADETTISVGARVAVVRFTQTWASGKYKDVGPKQLIVVADGDALRIGREEMLASAIVGAAADGAPLPRETFAFAIEAGGASYLVLEPAAQAAWAAGEPTLVSRDSPAIASYAVDANALPEAWRAWQGRPVALLPAAGRACASTVAELRILSGYEPHFGTLSEWAGDEHSTSRARATDQQVLGEIRSMEGALMLVARLGDRCPNALWGRVDDKNVVPRLMVAHNEVEPIVEAARERFRSLKGYAAVQRAFTQETGATTPWDEYEGAAPSVTVFYDRKVQRHFVAVEAVAGPGCGGFSGEFWALFQVVPRKAKQELVLLTDEAHPGPQFFPTAVVDADADGDVEFIGRNMLVRLVGTVYRVTDQWSWPDYDCPC